MSINASTAHMVEKLPIALLEHIPGLEPPPGLVSNFDDPPNLTKTVVAVISVSLFFTLAAVGLRAYSKINSAKAPTLDDYTTFLAMVGSVAYCGVSIDASVNHSTGTHQWHIRVSELISNAYLQEVLFFTAAYTPTVLMAKLSLFILYLRLFGASRSTKILAWVGIVCCSIFYTFGMIFPLATCGPRRGETRLVAFLSERCEMEKTYGYVTTAFNVISDFYLVIIPIPVVVGLNMSAEKKLRVCSVFMLGFLGCVCGVINSYYRVLLARTKDTRYYTAPVLLASIVEFNGGIVVGCMPVIQPAIASRFAKACHLSSVRSLIFRLSFKSKLSKGSPRNSDQYRDDKQHDQPYLKTGILHGADGNGRFMSTIGTKSGTERSWFRRSIMGTWRNNGSMNTTLYSTTSTVTANNGPTHHWHQQASNENILITTRISSASRSSQEREYEVV